MKTTDKELALISTEVNEMLDELAFKQAEHSYAFPELPKRKKNAAAPVSVVPTPSELSRPDFQNADNAVYRHQLESVMIRVDLDAVDDESRAPINQFCLGCAEYNANQFPCSGSSDCVDDCYTPDPNLAAAPSSSVPAVESRPPVPAAIAKLVDIDGFDPLASFADFGKLIELTYRLKIDYHAAITRIYAITTPEIPFSELTVHQIVSAIYAAAEEQSK